MSDVSADAVLDDAVPDDAVPDDGGTVTWRELWAETTAVIGDRARARWLCEVASGSVDGDEFLARLDEAATVRMVAHLDAMAARLGTPTLGKSIGIPQR